MNYVLGRSNDSDLFHRLYPHPETVDWEYIGAKYYDRAISLLMEELSNSGGQEVPLTPMPDEVCGVSIIFIQFMRLKVGESLFPFIDHPRFTHSPQRRLSHASMHNIS
jgi:hypothetical protein